MTEIRTTDEAFVALVEGVLSRGDRVAPRGLPSRELIGVGFRLADPRARALAPVRRRFKPHYAVGELLWHLGGSNSAEQICHYSRRWAEFAFHGTIQGSCYGARVFGGGDASRWQLARDLLIRDPQTRRCVIPISQADDLQVAAEVSDVPCTVSIQFLVRNGQLDLITHMRSNDLYFGFPYDVFLFTFWHEMMSLDLGLPLGRYHHFVGSLHIYEDRADELARSIGERDRRPFPSSMPPLDRLDQLREVLRLEKALRSGSIVDPRFSTGLSRCWDELILVLLQGELLRNGNVRGANLVRERLRDTVWFDHLADSTVTKKRRAS